MSPHHAAAQPAPPGGIDWEAAPEFGRRETILKVLRRLHQLHPGPVNLIETGTLRNESDRGCSGDGWSTVAWGWYAQQTGGRCWTVDVEAGAIETCRRKTEPYRQAIEYVVQDSVAFLRDWTERNRGPVQLLYLDSLDYHDHLREQSERHHLQEVEALFPSLATPALVLMDDTRPTEERDQQGRLQFWGKAALAAPYLLDRGFEVEWAEEGQALLSRL